MRFLKNMPLDPEVQVFLDQISQNPGPSPREAGAVAARQQMLAASQMLGPFPEVAAIEDQVIPGPGGPIPIRIYRPLMTPNRPVTVFFHGGGWVVGSIETHDGYCRALAAASDVTIVSVDYRLAPEHKFPAAFDDAYAAACWVAEHAVEFGGDGRRLAVAGDSAGGNLAAAVALAARDRRSPPLAFQLLIYPVTDAACDTPSYASNAEGYFLTRDAMHWFWEQYLARPEHGRHPYASPRAASDLSGLPPALVITAEYDPLCDEGEAYARRLNQAGGNVTLTRYDGVIHGFARRTQFFHQARTALDQAAAALRNALAEE